MPIWHICCLKNGCVTDGQTSGPKDRTPGLPGSDKKAMTMTIGEHTHRAAPETFKAFDQSDDET